MTAELGAAFNYSDLQGLSALRREAAADTPEARRAVAQQFEAMFLNMMLKEMRNASTRGRRPVRPRPHALSRGHARPAARAEPVAGPRHRPGRLDPAPVRRGAGQPRPSEPTGPVDAVACRRGRGRRGLRRDGQCAAGRRPVRRVEAGRPAADHPGPRAAGPRRTAPAAEPFNPATPQEFVERVWPHAERAARASGRGPEVLVAQAALETGWGRHTIRDGAGPSRTTCSASRPPAAGPASARRCPRWNSWTARRSAGARRSGRTAASGRASTTTCADTRQPALRSALAADNAEDYARALQAGGLRHRSALRGQDHWHRATRFAGPAGLRFKNPACGRQPA
jgi:peptidoglycan hydrolase FlgJ